VRSACAVPASTPDGQLLVRSAQCDYRKGDKEFHRDTLGALAKSFGLQPVSLVAIDDTWSALRVKRA
jgi:hypothetical protein